MTSLVQSESEIKQEVEKRENVVSGVVEDHEVEHKVKGKLGAGDAPSGFSLRALFSRPDNTAFFEEALEKYGHDGAIPPEDEKRLRRKLDIAILTCLAMCYCFYYVDKTTLSYAAIFGIKKDLNLHGTQYSWLSSIFYFGWMFWSFPGNFIMQKSPLATFLGINIFMWGALLMCQAASKNFADIAVIRFFSGAFEAVADPAFMLVITTFYTRAEQPVRISLYYSANGLGVAAGGLLGYAIGQINSTLPSWKYEFIIIGACCCLWGIVILFILPSSPANAAWLNREQRLMACARLRSNQTGIENRTYKKDQIVEAFTDIPTYVYFWIGFVGNVPNGGISNFSTLIIKGLGFDTLGTSLLGIPQGAFIVLWILSGCTINHYLRGNTRLFVCMAYMIPTIAGSLGFLLAPERAHVGRLMCFYLTGSYQTSFVLTLSLITSNTAGQTKKMVVSAMLWLGVCVGNISGPFFYKTNQAPKYRLGIGSILFCNLCELLSFVGLYFYYRWANAQKEKLRQELAAQNDGIVPDVNKTAFSDITDKQNPNFTYVY